MSKYEAYRVSGGNWAIREEGRYGSVGGPYVYYTEAEAKIIAFALDSISLGGELWTAFLTPAVEWDQYDGPTEGVFGEPPPPEAVEAPAQIPNALPATGDGTTYEED